MNMLSQLNTPAARAVIYSVTSGILAMFGAGAAISQESFNAWYTVAFAVIGIVPLVMAALNVNKGQPVPVESEGMRDPATSIAAEVARMAPAPEDVQQAIESEVSRWQGQVQESLGQAQGVAQSFIDDAQNYIGAHRMDQ